MSNRYHDPAEPPSSPERGDRASGGRREHEAAAPVPETGERKACAKCGHGASEHRCWGACQVAGCNCENPFQWSDPTLFSLTMVGEAERAGFLRACLIVERLASLPSGETPATTPQRKP